MSGSRLKKPITGKNPTTKESGIWLSRGFVRELVGEMEYAQSMHSNPNWSDTVYDQLLGDLTRVLEEKKKAKATRRPLKRTCHRCEAVVVCTWTNDPYAEDVNGTITEKAWWCEVCFGNAADDI